MQTRKNMKNQNLINENEHTRQNAYDLKPEIYKSYNDRSEDRLP